MVDSKRTPLEDFLDKMFAVHIKGGVSEKCSVHSVTETPEADGRPLMWDIGVQIPGGGVVRLQVDWPLRDVAPGTPICVYRVEENESVAIFTKKQDAEKAPCETDSYQGHLKGYWEGFNEGQVNALKVERNESAKVFANRESKEFSEEIHKEIEGGSKMTIYGKLAVIEAMSQIATDAQISKEHKKSIEVGSSFDRSIEAISELIRIYPHRDYAVRALNTLKESILEQEQSSKE